AITELIIACCDPDEIILFGSLVKGNGRSDSDVDLLIISKFRESRYLRAQELKELLKQYLRQLLPGRWLRSRVNCAQTGNLLKNFG
ncbi:MAG TPA: nucleotidyltransferase domain-containing protein, partial [Anaerolineales bacterium]|nr:nucleotidyltransferase domain-containing protein [Anaerolineales bacterium]